MFARQLLARGLPQRLLAMALRVTDRTTLIFFALVDQALGSARWVGQQAIPHIARAQLRVVSAQPGRLYQAHDHRRTLVREFTASEQPCLATYVP